MAKQKRISPQMLQGQTIQVSISSKAFASSARLPRTSSHRVRLNPASLDVSRVQLGVDLPAVKTCRDAQPMTHRRIFTSGDRAELVEALRKCRAACVEKMRSMPL